MEKIDTKKLYDSLLMINYTYFSIVYKFDWFTNKNIIRTIIEQNRTNVNKKAKRTLRLSWGLYS